MARRKHRRRSHRRSLMNPLSPSALLSGPKEMVTKEFAVEAVSVAAGFVLPGVVMSYLPPTLRDTKIKFYGTKLVSIAVLSAAAGMVSKKASRMVLLGGGVSLLLDLWTDFRASSTPAPAAGTKAYYGGMQGTDYWYGPNIGDDIVLSESGDEAF